MSLYVYEATNQDRKERFIGVSQEPPRWLDGSDGRQRPACALDWDLSNHTIRCNLLMETKSASQAEFFVWEFKRATPMPGWKLI